MASEAGAEEPVATPDQMHAAKVKLEMNRYDEVESEKVLAGEEMEVDSAGWSLALPTFVATAEEGMRLAAAGAERQAADVVAGALGLREEVEKQSSSTKREVFQVKQYSCGTKEKEVIYISDEESSDSSIKPQTASLLKVKPEPVNEGLLAPSTFPDFSSLHDVNDAANMQFALRDPPSVPSWRGKEPIVVPKAEVIYGTGPAGPESATCREVALAKVAAEWGQYGTSPGGATQQVVQAQVNGNQPLPLAIREAADTSQGLCVQAMRAGNGKNPNIRTTHEGPRRPAVTVGSYTVQCFACHKWRWVPNKQVYEYIREMNSQHPFQCEYAYPWSPDCSCEQPADITAGDVGFVWAMDKANISRPPPGWERKVVIRGEGSLIFSDVYYVTPDGRTLRSMNDIVKFLAEHPAMEASLAEFNFSRPRPMDPKLQKKRRQELLGAGTSGSPVHKLFKS